MLAAPSARNGSLTVVETFTAGHIAARDRVELAATLGLDGPLISGELSREGAERVAPAAHI